ILRGDLVVLFPPLGQPVSPGPETEPDEDEQAYERFWAAFKHAIANLEPPPDYLLVDTRTGLSPISKAAVHQLQGDLVLFVVPDNPAAESGTVALLQDIEPYVGRKTA